MYSINDTQNKEYKEDAMNLEVSRVYMSETKNALNGIFQAEAKQVNMTYPLTYKEFLQYFVMKHLQICTKPRT